MDHWDPDLSGVHSKKISKMNWLEFRKAFLSHNTSFMLKTKKSLLVVLQGIDGSGKDDTVSHVMKALNPQNCYIKSFKIPNDEAMSHDYIWRIHKAVPAKGQICIFNRSHYEDITEPVVMGAIS